MRMDMMPKVYISDSITQVGLRYGFIGAMATIVVSIRSQGIIVRIIRCHVSEKLREAEA